MGAAGVRSREGETVFMGLLEGGWINLQPANPAANKTPNSRRSTPPIFGAVAPAPLDHSFDGWVASGGGAGVDDTVD
jgi:hypothetical protein